MNAWVVNPADCLHTIAHNVCYVRGTVAVCKDVLHIVRDKGLGAGNRLQELTKYCSEGVMYHPREPLPERPPYRPKLREGDASEEYSLLTYYLDEKFGHDYIRGAYACSVLIGRMIQEKDGRSEDEILRGIVAFCTATLDIASAL